MNLFEVKLSLTKHVKNLNELQMILFKRAKSVRVYHIAITLEYISESCVLMTFLFSLHNHSHHFQLAHPRMSYTHFSLAQYTLHTHT